MGRGRGRGGGGGGPQPPASPRWAHGTAPVPGPSGQALFLRGPRAPRGGFGCTHTTAPQRAVGAASGERPQQRLLGSGGGGGSRVWVQEPTKTPWGRGGGARWRSCRAWPSKKKKTTPRWQKNTVWAWWPRPRPALGLGWAPGPAAPPGVATRSRPQTRVWDGADAHPVLRATLQTPAGAARQFCHRALSAAPLTTRRWRMGATAGPGGRAPLPTPKNDPDPDPRTSAPEHPTWSF